MTVSLALEERVKVTVMYAVEDSAGGGVGLWLNVCGTVLSPSPYPVPPPPLLVVLDSVILAGLSSEIRETFHATLTSASCQWLGEKRVGNLLYRATYGGMDPASFHRYCDERGPTLVLVLAKGGWVFGGYAGVSSSWQSSRERNCGRLVPCPDAFVFSVVGPYGTMVKFDLTRPELGMVLCSSLYGPTFKGAFYMVSWYPECPRLSCRCTIGEDGGLFRDVLRKGADSFTGGLITPVEIEVFRVFVPAS